MATETHYRLFPSVRFLTSAMCMVVMLFSHMLRANLSISEKCIIGPSCNGSTCYNWTETQFGNLQASLYYGYIFPQVFGGVLAVHFSPKMIIAVATLISSVFTFVFPIAASLSYGAAVASRFVVGFFLGTMYSSVFQLISAWICDEERGRLIGLIESGPPLGIILAHPMAVELCFSAFPSAWRYSFFGPGVFGIVLTVLILAFVRSEPQDSRLISSNEINYLERKIPTRQNSHKVDWNVVFKTRSLWGFYLCLCLSEFFYTIMGNVMWSLLASDPSADTRMVYYSIVGFWVLYMICVPIYGWISDYLIDYRGYPRMKIRKLYVIIACMIPAFISLFLGFTESANSYYPASMILFFIAHGAVAANAGGGVYLTANDIAPDYAGVAWGLGNTAGCVVSIVSLIVLKTIQEKDKTAAWKTSMFGSFVTNTLATLAFCFLVNEKDANQSSRESQGDNAESRL